MESFNSGDVVQLKSGGLPMTIGEFTTDGSGKALCYWQDKDGDPQSHWFAPVVLERVSK
jgi:uncharacterized protein YodC (DUF2158 family)